MENMIRSAKIRPKSFSAVTDGRPETAGCEHTVFIRADVIITNRVQSRGLITYDYKNQGSDQLEVWRLKKTKKTIKKMRTAWKKKYKKHWRSLELGIHSLSVCAVYTVSVYLSFFIALCLAIDQFIHLYIPLFTFYFIALDKLAYLFHF